MTTIGPLMSFVLIAYNQEKFIRDAVIGAFSQTFSPLEIILSDDCSSDRTFEIMEELANDYEGQHKIILNRNKHNLGLAAHVNKVMTIVQSDLVVLAAGDDVSFPERAQASWDLLSSNSDCTAVSFSTITFTKDYDTIARPTSLANSFEKYSIDQLIKNCEFHINGAARTFRRSVFEKFGPLSPDSPTEDSTILLRCLLAGPVIKHNDPLVYYRIHGKNLSASNNIFFLDYSRIHCQYMTDLNIANQKGLIDEVEYKLVKASLENKLERKMLWSKFNRQKNKVMIFVSSILLSKVFSPKEKVRYLRQVYKYIKSRGN